MLRLQLAAPRLLSRPQAARRLAAAACLLAAAMPLAADPGPSAKGGAAPGIALAGRALDETGRGLAGAAVTLLPLRARGPAAFDPPASPLATERTDDDGRFALVAPAGMYRLRLDAPGRLAMARDLVPLLEPTRLPAAILHPAVPAAALVVDPGGLPVAGATVLAGSGPGTALAAQRRHGWSPVPRVAVTDDAGRATVPRVAGEALRWRALATGLAPSPLVEDRAGDGDAEGDRRGGPRRLVLEPGRRLEARVRAADGTAVAGALVRLGPGWPAGRSDAAGRLELTVSATRETTITAEAWAGGALRHVRTVHEPSESDPDRDPDRGALTIVLPDLTALEGRVVAGGPEPEPAAMGDGDGGRHGPLAGALVWLPHTPWTFVTTGDDGRFRLPAARSAGPRAIAVRGNGADETARLAVAATGYLGTLVGGGRPTGLRPAADGDEPDHEVWTIALRPAAAVAGQVVDPGGRPVDGAVVDILTTGGRGAATLFPHHRTTTDPAGRFAFSALDPNLAYELRAAADGYAPRLGVDVPASALADTRPGGAGRAAASRPTLRLALSPTRRASGRAVDAAGAPVPGATAGLLPAPSRADDDESGGDGPARRDPAGGGLALATAERRAVAGRDGVFTFAEVPAGRFHLAVAGEGFAPAVVRGLEVPASGDVDLGVVTLLAGATLAGIVLDPDGDPVADAEIVARARPSIAGTRDGGRAGERRVRSGEDGTFEIAELIAGTVLDLEAGHPRFGRAGARGVSVPAADPTAAASAVVLRLRPLFAVRGRTVDRHGGAVAGADVEVWADDAVEAIHRARSGEDGGFELAGVAAGTIRLLARAAGYQPAAIDALAVPVDPALDTVELVLAPAAALAGRVRDLDGAPVAGAAIRIEGGSASAKAGALRARSGSDGRYRVPALAAGRHSVHVAHPDFAEQRSALEIGDGDNVRDWTLESGYAVRGRLLDHRGQPVGGAGLRIVDEDGGRGRAATSDLDGAFEWPSVPPGRYRIRVRADGRPGIAPAPRLEVHARAPDALELSLPPPLALAGELTGVGFDDIGRVAVSAFHPEAGRRAAAVDPDGRFRLDDLSPGTWILRAEDGGRHAEREVELTAGAPEPFVELDLGGTLTFAGRVDLDGRPAAGVEVVLRAAAGGRGGADTRTDLGGAFRLPRLVPGRYHLLLSEPTSGLWTSLEIVLEGDLERVFDFATGTLAGRVLGAGGPLPLATLTLLDPGRGGPAGIPVTSRRSDTAGAFVFGRVVAGLYRLRVAHPEHAGTELLVEVLSDRPAEPLEIVLDATR